MATRIHLIALSIWLLAMDVQATPANKAALEAHYDRFLARSLANCVTCHLPSDKTNPESLAEFTHNPFGERLRQLGEVKEANGTRPSLAKRLQRVASEDTDGDGVPNELELLLGFSPGNPGSEPALAALAQGAERQKEFAEFEKAYRWRPFDPVPPVQPPVVAGLPAGAGAIDRFIAAGYAARGLTPRPEAAPEILLRRVYLDLIGLSPKPEDLAAYLSDTAPGAYERVVERLLADPRHGERWGRHWMDVWRYSDWAGWSGGNQIRDSKPHIWRWRDWIVESINQDKSYARMIVEMLAADEAAPSDEDALRATGFLVRNFKLLSREQWMEDTVKHTAQAFLGVTIGCAKCHDHMFDPISQREYYQMRAVFEPHWVRTDRVRGETNTAVAGLVRVFDSASNAPTYLFARGDERHPQTNEVIIPGVPQSLHGTFKVQPVTLPLEAAFPDRRDFVRSDLQAAADRGSAAAQVILNTARTNTALGSNAVIEAELKGQLAVAQGRELRALLSIEEIADPASAVWKERARTVVAVQRERSLLEARLQLLGTTSATQSARRALEAAQAKGETNTLDKLTKQVADSEKKRDGAAQLLASAEKAVASPLDEKFTPRVQESYPRESTGRRLALARWITETNNPLTARVAMNQLWLRHFGRGIVATPADFGRNGRPPTHPELLDWLAGEFMRTGWSMKSMHRLIVTSRTYRMASTPDERNAAVDPENSYLWRMPSRRMEAELIRDNLLQASGQLDSTMGGPEIDHMQGMTSKRRSIYLRQAAEKEVEFLKIFDGPSVTECYVRRPSVVPQQALAMSNSGITAGEAKALAQRLGPEFPDDEGFARAAFLRVLARAPQPEEWRACVDYLKAGTTDPARVRERFVAVLFNHNDFITIR